jgi:adenine-specific DNA-methyltransferase
LIWIAVIYGIKQSIAKKAIVVHGGAAVTMTSTLMIFAATQQQRFDTATPSEARKERGHYGTPSAVADFMAGMFSDFPNGTLRILDPGAGVGTLSAAVCQRVLAQGSPRKLFFELWENDPNLIPLLEGTMAHCQRVLQDAGHEMDFVVRVEDFITSNGNASLFSTGPEESFDLAILNPPYFKLRKESVHAQAMSHVVHGQPNIYPLFMAAAADLLRPGGEIVAITPRSYFNGPYFKRFRKWFFQRFKALHIHLFESRTEAFKNDAVLQENVILRAKKGCAPKDVVVTTSSGRDFTDLESQLIPYEHVIDDSSTDRVIRVPTSRLERQIIATVDGLSHRFCDLGFAVSTGPVVTFRSTQFLRHDPAADTAPLLWMHNVRPFITQFPPKNSKPTHIEVSEKSRKLLLPSSTYVLLKRFTAKEEKRRLVAGIVQKADLYSEWVGLENHLNYIYRRGSVLSATESLGLAAYFNSVLVDRYFRSVSGNTQVNASEIRAMPVPDVESIVKIGEDIAHLESKSFYAVESIVGRALNLHQNLIDQLIEISK